ncbi:MAG: class I SAM-dependent methyltransferase [Patescibacteria group bacterium]
MQDTTKKGYKAIAHEFAASRERLWPELNIFKKYIGDNDQVLDLGCGNGRLIQLFEGRQVKYLGIDNNAELIEYAKEKYPDKKFIVSDVLEFNPEEKFDVIFMIAVLNHFNRGDRKDILKKVYQWLTPGGYLLMANWNMNNLKNKKSRWYSKTENGAVITEWKTDRGEVGKLIYYTLTKSKIKKELKDFDVLKNNYYTNGKRSSVLFGNNLLTAAKKINVECEAFDKAEKGIQGAACAT